MTRSNKANYTGGSSECFVEPSTYATRKLKSSLERLRIDMMNVLMIQTLTMVIFVRTKAFCTISSEKSPARLAKPLLGWCRQPRGRNF
jgi:hypothetical protein